MNASVKPGLAPLERKGSLRSSLSVGLGTRILRNRIFQILRNIEEGFLMISDPDGEYRFGNPDSPDGLRASLQLFDQRFYAAAAFRGSLGAGEAYMSRYWDCDDLTAVARVFARNSTLLNSLDSGWVRFLSPFLRVYHKRRRNTRRGSRRNISEHYDLGNDFFSLFLDESMMYSCAYFESDATTLGEASRAKLDKVCQQLQLSPTDHVIEIGSGWGGFALHAAEKYGCLVTTTTVSREQYDFIQRKVGEAGLSGRINVLLQDYRDLQGTYDKLVSIEMIEAVGDEYLDLYFRKCSQLLKPSGRMLIQAITIASEFYEESRKGVDFIQRYIFPGSSLPSVPSIRDSAMRSRAIRLTDTIDMTDHYPRTLREWRQRLHAKSEQVKAQGFPDRFLRMWEFYFCYCEAGFLERHISDFQFVFEKTGRGDEQ